MIRSLLDNLKDISDSEDEFSEIGQVKIKNNSYVTGSEKIKEQYEQHLESLQNEKLTGFRYLKPPGVNRTLKNYHEEQEYAQDSTGFEYSFDTNQTSGHIGDTGRIGSVGSLGSLEHTSHSNVDENNNVPENRNLGNITSFDDSIDISMPSLNASFSRIYHPEANESNDFA